MTAGSEASRRVLARTPVAPLPASSPKRPTGITGRMSAPPETSSPGVCSFRLPQMCGFRLPLTPFTGRVSHPLDGEQSFMTSPHRHSPLTSLAWSHRAPTPHTAGHEVLRNGRNDRRNNTKPIHLLPAHVQEPVPRYDRASRRVSGPTHHGHDPDLGVSTAMTSPVTVVRLGVAAPPVPVCHAPQGRGDRGARNSDHDSRRHSGEDSG